VPGCPDERIRNSGRGAMVDLPTVYAATVTTATWLVADGTNSPANGASPQPDEACQWLAEVRERAPAGDETVSRCARSWTAWSGWVAL